MVYALKVYISLDNKNKKVTFLFCIVLTYS